MNTNLLTFGGSGYIAADSQPVANNGVIRGPNGEILQTAMVAGSTLPTAVAGGTGILNGGFSYQAYQTLTSNTTLTATSPKVNYVDATAGAFAVTLPLASTVDQQEFEFYKIDGAHNVTLTGNGSDNIQLGVTTANTAVMSTQGQKLSVRRGASSIWRAA